VYCEVATEETGLMFKARCLSGRGNSGQLEIIEPIRTGAAPEAPRYHVEGVIVEVNLDWLQLREQVLDVSATGLAFLSKAMLEVGSTIDMIVHTDGAKIPLSGEIRYCRKAPAHGDLYRVGVKIGELSRLDAAKWSRIRDAAA
jgi:hypothetical protein